MSFSNVLAWLAVEFDFLDHFKTYLLEKPLLLPIVQEYFYQDDANLRIQFLLDCSVLPMVSSALQMFGDDILNGLFKMTRTQPIVQR